MTAEDRRRIRQFIDRVSRDRVAREDEWLREIGIEPSTMIRGRRVFRTTHPGTKYIPGCDCERCENNRELAREHSRRHRAKQKVMA